jgi:hypothetical protein
MRHELRASRRVMKYLVGFLFTGVIAGVFCWWLQSASPDLRDQPTRRPSSSSLPRKPIVQMTQANWIHKVGNARKENFSVLLVRISHLADESLKQELADSLLNQWNNLPPEDFQSFRSMVENSDQELRELLMGAVLRNENFREDFIEMVAKSVAPDGTEAAAIWAFQLLAQERDNFVCRELGVTWAKENPAAGLALLGTLSNGGVANQLALEIGNSIQVSTLEEMDKLAGTLNGSVKEAFCGALLSHSMGQMDQAALAGRLGHAEPTELLSKVVAGLAADDPQQAFQWIAQFSSESCKTAAAKTIFQTWSREQPVEALRHVKDTYPDSPFLIESVVTGALQSRHDSEMAWQLLKELSDGEWMTHGLQALFASLPEKQATADFEQVMLQETNPRVRASGLTYLARVRSQSQ